MKKSCGISFFQPWNYQRTFLPHIFTDYLRVKQELQGFFQKSVYLTFWNSPIYEQIGSKALNSSQEKPREGIQQTFLLFLTAYCIPIYIYCLFNWLIFLCIVFFLHCFEFHIFFRYLYFSYLKCLRYISTVFEPVEL